MTEGEKLAIEIIDCRSEREAEYLARRFSILPSEETQRCISFLLGFFARQNEKRNLKIE